MMRLFDNISINYWYNEDSDMNMMSEMNKW